MTDKRNRPGVDVPEAAPITAGKTCSDTTGPADNLAAWHQQCEWENAHQYADGFSAGYAAALRDIAEGYAELHHSWKLHPNPELTYEQRVTQRLADMAPTTPDWLDRRAQAHRDHDRRCIEQGRRVRLTDADRSWFAEAARRVLGERRPEPYSSSANGTNLTVQEREMFGELGRVA